MNINKWAGCLVIAETLTKLAPRRLSGWLALASAQHHLGDNVAAYQTLTRAVDAFPDYWGVAYDLACYACLAGEYSDAEHWLKKAFDLADDALKLKLKAPNDPKLAALWQRRESAC